MYYPLNLVIRRQFRFDKHFPTDSIITATHDGQNWLPRPQIWSSARQYTKHTLRMKVIAKQPFCTDYEHRTYIYLIIITVN